MQYNTGTDAAPVWTGAAIAFGGSGGANELRWAPASGATGTTSSANWPYVTRPTSGTAAIPQLWAFTANTTGSQVATYDGSNTNSRVLRWDFDGNGTLAAAFQFSAFGDNTHTAPSPGTQPGGQSGSPIVNGSADTSNTSYLKLNAYGYGVDASGAQQTPAAGSLLTPVAAGDGTAGSVSPASGAWIATHYQSAQGWAQYVLDGVISNTFGHAGDWYWVCVLFTGVGQSTGTLLPVITLQYSYS